MTAFTTIGSERIKRTSGVKVALPRIPVIGREEAYYAKRARRAERDGDVYARCAYKAAQYITLALNPLIEWREKVKYFQHALDRHCEPPPYPDEATWMFYAQLADLVRENASREALRLASVEDDLYAARLAMGQRREIIENEAEQFFAQFFPHGDECPEWLNADAFEQLQILRNHWI